MPKHLLPVPHVQQRESADCLAACATMVLTHVGIEIPYHQLLKVLRIGTYGTPGRNLLHLADLGVQVTYGPSSFAELTERLRDGHPSIALVRTSELPYWTYATNHAVVIVGFDDESVYVNDPHFGEAPQQVSIGDFMLAWLEFDYRAAVIELQRDENSLSQAD